MEYNYFEMERFKAERGLALKQEHQVLAFSQAPTDADYLGFLNTLRIRTLVAQAETITPLGDLTDFASWRGEVTRSPQHTVDCYNRGFLL